MPATKADIRRKAMKKKVDEGYVKQKPGNAGQKITLNCSVCKKSFNQTAKGVEVKQHMELASEKKGVHAGKSLTDLFGAGCAAFYAGKF